MRSLSPGSTPTSTRPPPPSGASAYTPPCDAPGRSNFTGQTRLVKTGRSNPTGRTRSVKPGRSNPTGQTRPVKPDWSIPTGQA